MKDRLVLIERAYEALRNDIKSGFYLPGERIEASVAAMRLRSSVSPIRAALHRLTGERLVDTHTQGGFSVPHLTEVGLREQFEWNHQLALLALRWPTAHPVPPPDLGKTDDFTDTVTAIENITTQLGRRVPGGELRAALANSNIRLHRARQIEVEMTPSLHKEVRAWLAPWSAGDLDALAGHLQRHHDRRQALISQIIERLHRAGSGEA